MNGVKELREEPKIELRRLTTADAEAFFWLIKNNLGPLEKSEGAGEKIDVTLELVQNMFNEDTETVRMGIFKEGDLIGHINLMPQTADTAAIAYLVDADARKNTLGIADMAFKQFLRAVPEQYRVLEASVKRDNTASQKFLRRSGFVFKENIKDEHVDNVVYRYYLPGRQGRN